MCHDPCNLSHIGFPSTWEYWSRPQMDPKTKIAFNGLLFPLSIKGIIHLKKYCHHYYVSCDVILNKVFSSKRRHLKECSRCSLSVKVNCDQTLKLFKKKYHQCRPYNSLIIFQVHLIYIIAMCEEQNTIAKFFSWKLVLSLFTFITWKKCYNSAKDFILK